MSEQNLKEGQVYLLDGNVLVEATYNDNTAMWQLHEPEDRSSWLVLPNGKLQGLQYDSARNVFLLEPEPDLWNTGDLNEADENTPKLPKLLRRVELLADEKHDGHLTLMRLSTGWKATFGAPDYASDEGKQEIQKLRTFKTLYEAVNSLL
jgi:hypothetical protein